MIETTFAVVVNWNGGDANLACVASLLAAGLAEERIVFVDNGSSDGSLEAVVARHPKLIVLRNATNTGYAAATNQGLERAFERGAELAFLVNNDVVLDEDTLQILVEALAADPALGIVGPRVVYLAQPERIWCAGGLLTFRQNLSTMLGHGELDAERFQIDRDVDYVPGCALLARRSLLERIGLLEEGYFAYHEDVELCLKAREAGARVRLVGRARILHDAHHSTGGGYNPRRKYMMGLNTVWFLRRHGNVGRWLSFVLHDVLSLPLVFVYRAFRGEGGAVLAKARGMWDGLRGKRLGTFSGADEGEDSL